MTTLPDSARTGPAISDAVRQLAAFAAAAFAPDGVAVPLDPTLLMLGIQRHRVGPLLQAAVDQGQVLADDESLTLLKRHAQANARNAGFARLLEGHAVRQLGAAGVASLVFKGQPMAKLLYPDPAWRHSGDIDILVRPDDFPAAIKTLIAVTGGPSKPDLSGKRFLAGLAARSVRDVAFHQHAMGQLIELHQRLFFPRALSEVVPAIDRDFHPRMPLVPTEIPAPRLGTGLALYLLMHGAVSDWWRLKWLVDIYALMPKLDNEAAGALAGAAEASGVAASIKAGLRLTQAVFGSALPESLQAWIDETSAARAVDRRLQYYVSQLNEPTVPQLNPLSARMDAIWSHFLLEERLGPRFDILFRAPVSSGLRLLLGVG